MQETPKQAQYENLLTTLRSLAADEPDLIANMANFATEIDEAFHFLWNGFYRVVGKWLVLGPYRGPLACTRIAYGRGVCGTAWAEGRTLIVPDVHLFNGHIACSSLSQSEIVVPVRQNGKIVAVLDVDSASLATFDSVDAHYLEQIAALLQGKGLAPWPKQLVQCAMPCIFCTPTA